MRQNGYERSYIKHGMKRLPGWIQKLRTYPKCALKACLWCVGGFSGWKTMGHLSHQQVMGHLKVMEGIKQWLPALGTEESWVCAHICVCLCCWKGQGGLCVPLRVKKSKWDGKSWPYSCSFSHSVFLFADQGVPGTFPARRHVLGLGRSSSSGISPVSWDITGDITKQVMVFLWEAFPKARAVSLL